ncbi:MAG TPA: hypothetical protein DEP72_03945 [Clostridiales bacterium]|nr:MAG: hypothetical protein A2Y18_04220 [Clostridiales bacterium GWD2_32_19]HCC07299.1 hypothetical protein [Clostridiales bacterium]
MQNRYNTVDLNEIKGTKQHYRKVKKFILIVTMIVLPFLLIAGFFTFMHVNALITGEVDLLKGLADNPFGQVFNMIGKTQKDRITGAIFGVDKEGVRTDVILVATIDKKSNKIDVISVPRDTRITLAPERQTELKGLHKYAPSTGVMKITEVHAYAPNNKRNEYSVKEVERILDVDIDYYVKVDVKAFRKIVDQVGGIKFTVERNLKYRDPVQDLYINLKKGEQTLNGSQAEQLVRFRKYMNGDLDRIKVQQNFLKAFYEQVFNVKNIGNLPKIAVTLYQYVDTNFGIGDVPAGINMISKVDASNVTMHVVPGEPKTIKGVSYFIYDKVKTKELIDSIYNADLVQKEQTTDKVVTE